jgi:hypothetical protein
LLQLCIIPRLFPAADVLRAAGAALADLRAALTVIRRDKGIDITLPGAARPNIDNYHELSMRE